MEVIPFCRRCTNLPERMETHTIDSQPNLPGCVLNELVVVVTVDITGKGKNSYFQPLKIPPTPPPPTTRI